VIEHECNIGEFVHVASGSILSGNVTVGAGTHIGAGSIIRQGICIGEGSMIGIGSVVVKNIGDYVTAYGNPCREVKHE
jgi:acetyltransferase-like isoleucine patch superfamily enzyme